MYRCQVLKNENDFNLRNFLTKLTSLELLAPCIKRDTLLHSNANLRKRSFVTLIMETKG